MISAKLIAHSIGPGGQQIATFQTHFNRFILPEVNTHKIASLSASSSRAIPTVKILAQVENEPAMPVSWRMNQAGMQPAGDASPEVAEQAEQIWRSAAKWAAFHAKQMSDLGIAKEISNRLLEPYTWTNQVFTATSFGNMFYLRCHSDAQKEFQTLANLMREELKKSTPRQLTVGEWHLPYITDEERKRLPIDDQLRCSAARCARVSYQLHDGSPTTVMKDIDLFEKLAISKPAHMSPCAHQGRVTDDPKVRSRNFTGFIQFRETLELFGFAGYEPVGVVDGFL